MRLLKRIDKDSMCALFNVEMSHSKCLINITRLLGEGIIDENDLEGFTPELREKASFFHKKMKRHISKLSFPGANIAGRRQRL